MTMDAHNGAEPSDEDLVAAFKGTGGREMLDTLLRRHVGRVRAMMAQMVLDDADADDLTQEVFLRAIRGLSGFEGRCRFSTWLCGIAMNVARSFLRRKQSVFQRTVQVSREQADPRGVRAEDVAMGNELDTKITQAMAVLPPSLRAAIVLTSLHGLRAKEAARIEGCSTAVFYWRVHRARKSLRQQLGTIVETG